MLIDELARGRLIRRFGPDVDTWIAQLPELVDRLARRWDLTVDRQLPGGTSITLHCGTAVLKLCPDLDVARGEHDALHAWDGVKAMVGLIDADLDAGALLLEPIEPATPIADFLLPDLLTDLHIPRTDGFGPVSERVDFVFELLRRKTGKNVDRYHRKAADLALDDVPATLLHGDLHVGNVLDGGERGPVAIDPRPCVGDPAIDAVDMVYAGDDHDARIEALSGVVDGDRLKLWCEAFRPFFP